MYLYRCERRINGIKCKTRNALKRKIEDYARTPVCWSCKKPLTGYQDKWQEKRNKETTCHCDGLPFPHRAGSTVWCVEHPTGPTEQDYEERYG